MFVTWGPQARLKGGLALKMYDETNHPVADSTPGKLDLRPGDRRLSSWRVPVPPRPGMYRADVVLDGVPIWRAFVRITE